METLSDKQEPCNCNRDVCVFKKYREDDVKDFISDIINWLNTKHCHCEICTGDYIKELSGDKLFAYHAKEEQNG